MRNTRTRTVWLSVLALAGALSVVAIAADEQRNADAKSEKSTTINVPEPKQVGGEPDGIVQVANLVYAGTKTSTCFSDHFLVQAEKDSKISTSRRFHAVKLGSEELFEFPLVIMTGEGAFDLPDAERQNLRKFIEGGGMLLASASCSSPEWDRAFRKEMAQIFPENAMTALGMDHPVFHTVYDVNRLNAKHGTPRPPRPLRQLSGTAAGIDEADENDANNWNAMMYAAMQRQLPARGAPSEAIGAQPGNVSYRVTVSASFSVNER